MDSSFREERSETQQNTKRSWMKLWEEALGILKWLAGLIKLTAEEQEQAGIYPERLGDE